MYAYLVQMRLEAKGGANIYVLAQLQETTEDSHNTTPQFRGLV